MLGIPSVDRPRASYLVCTTPRSGSHMLCETLLGTGVAGRPVEIFEADRWAKGGDRPHRITDSALFVPAIYKGGTTPNGVFGATLMWSQLEWAVPRLRHYTALDEAPCEAVLHRVFPALRVVHLVRQDRLRQAISWHRANQDGVWVRAPGEPMGPRPAGRYDYHEISRLRRDIVDVDERWQALFARLGVPVHRVLYEDLLTPDGFYREVRAVLRHLGLPDGIEVPPPTTHRLADELSDEWASRFVEESGQAEPLSMRAKPLPKPQ